MAFINYSANIFKYMKGFIQGISELSGVPFDEMSGFRYIITNNAQLFAEGIAGLGNYTETELEIRLRRGKLLVSGENLCVEHLGRDEILVSGKIKCIAEV